MEQKAFNLLDEKWILATDTQGRQCELSLVEVITRAHELRALSGEIVAQDVAILRLLLAILYAVYTRTDEYDQAREEKDPEAMRQIWKEIWNAGKFDEDRIMQCLLEYHERFYLVHPERPFYQIAGLDVGTEYHVGKLIGDLAESGNKVQLFAMYTGEAKESFSYSSAARWLVHLNSFVDNSAKPKSKEDGKGKPGGGPGWLGHLGLVWACGSNLFETLMFNFALHDRDENPWPPGQAAWELDRPRTAERTEIPIPESQQKLLTLQSRRVLLYTNNNMVTGYLELGGDRFSHEEAFVELMTAWNYSKKENVYRPRKHDTSKQLWRTAASIISETETTKIPGVIVWLTALEDAGIISSHSAEICAMSVDYGPQSCGVIEVWADSISLNMALLSRLKESWITRITTLVENTEKMVSRLGWLASDIAKAMGDTDGKHRAKATREEAYFALDMPFRSWLAELDPMTGDIDDAEARWKDIAKKMILRLGEDIVSQAGSVAFKGRVVEDKKTKKPTSYTAPEAYNKFHALIQNCKE